MPNYEFELTDGSRADYVYPASLVPPIGELTLLPDGKEGKRVFTTTSSAFFGKNHNPRFDDERRESVQAFHEPNPANPGGCSDHQLVKDQGLKTMACSRWV